MRNTFVRNRRWILAFTAVIGLTFFALFAPVWSAQAQYEYPSAQAYAQNAQILSDDLEIGEGDVYENDVVVYDGDVKLQDGGLIRGNLVVYSGDIDVEAGGEVTGDVSAFSGDVELAGRVGGNISSFSGDIDLSDTAYVGGDVSVVRGEIGRDDGAYIGGNVVRGPNLKLPSAVPPFGNQPNQFAFGVDDASHAGGMGFLGGIGRLIGRLFSALLFTVIVGFLTFGVAVIRPPWVDEIERNVRQETVPSFVVGLAVNFALTLLTLVLVITLCLWPIPLLTLLIINLIGVAGISQGVGRYVSRLVNLKLSAPLTAGLGAVVLLGLLAPFWALGGCLRFVVILAMLLLGALGTGAFLLPWIGRWRNGEPLFLPPPTSTPAASVPPDPTEPDDSDVMEGQGVLQASALPDVSPPPAPAGSTSDDLTAIAGIGPVFERRLNAAGVRTFAQLAAMSPQQIADIIGWSVERVVKSELIEQARQLAA